MADIYYIHQFHNPDKSKDVIVNTNGHKQTLKELANIYGLDYDDLWERVIIKRELLHPIIIAAAEQAGI